MICSRAHRHHSEGPLVLGLVGKASGCLGVGLTFATSPFAAIGIGILCVLSSGVGRTGSPADSSVTSTGLRDCSRRGN